jgi:FkbM family methyltransferase
MAMFYKLLNAYTQHSGFPKKGLRFFLKGMRLLGIADKVYLKKIKNNLQMYLMPEDHVQQHLFWYEYYEKPVEAGLKKFLKADSIFIDIGANVGYFSLYASRLAPQGKVIAFEPVSHLFEALQKNIEVNNITNIKAVQVAIGAANEERDIYIAATDNAGMSSFGKPENYSGKKELVKVYSFDSWFALSGLEKVDLVKIDVEGFELAALKGMKETINRFKPFILIEANPQTLSYFQLTVPDLLKYAAELSYLPFVISEEGKLKPADNTDIMKEVTLALVSAGRTNELKL